MKAKQFLMTILSMVLVGLALASCEGKKDKPTPEPEPNPEPVVTTTEELKGDIAGHVSLKSQVAYTLNGAVNVKKGASLTIPAGTVIKVKEGAGNYILVEQGGKIFIEGTADNPVVMTADKEGAKAGHWGGLVVNGFAPITNGGTNKTEIDPNKPYGGNNAADNSGVIRYLKLEYTGAKNSADVEHNGLTLNGVGNGTKIENIFILKGADDGIEFFGGSVNVTNILVIDADDDMFDFTEGYSGTVTNAYGIWSDGHVSTEKDPCGIEADGNHDGLSPNGKPQSNFKINGLTIDLQMKPSTDNGAGMTDLMRIRRGATANITNALIKGTGYAANVFNITDKKGNGNPATKIEYNNQLEAAPKAFLVGEANLIDNDALKGADASVFAWTGYKLGEAAASELALGGAIVGTKTLQAGATYILNGAVEVKAGASLTIPAGVTIKAKEGFNQYILVEQGGKIFINGTAAKPVRMTADKEGAKAGHWGGLVINGYAPITNGGTNKTEIDPTKPYGGNNPADNSGVINYLILEFTGAKDSGDIEHNGLTLNGVGNGTQISNIFVPNGSDDAIEFFGGTVNVTNILAVNADDDMFDFTEGYSGTLTNAYGVWEKGHVSTEKDPRAVEADGNHDGLSPNGKPQSNFKINGMTVDLQMAPSDDKGSQMNDVIKVRRGALANITNTLIKGTGKAGSIVNMTDSKGDGNSATKIELNNLLTDNSATPLKGTATVVQNDGAKGADASVFAWTGYKLSGASTAARELSGAITSNKSLEAGATYILKGAVEVKSGASLTIPAGVTIKAVEGFDQYILVEQGGKIFVNGTAANPVRMTADKEGAKAGHWGGLVINGYAPITNGGTNKTEIDPSKPYGGNNSGDNSGVINYLILEYTGAKNNGDIEHNGLTLNGVGNGTKISNLYVLNGADDAIEFFGGSVNVTNILAVNADDDMFDFTEGYNGILTNAYGIWEKGHVSTEKDPRGVEADGNHDGLSPNGKPQSNFKIDGMTIELRMDPSDVTGAAMNDAIKIRRGALATIVNALIKGTGATGTVINMTDGKGDGNAASSIEYSNELKTPAKTEVKGTVKATKKAGLKGADKGAFSWTSYKF